MRTIIKETACTIAILIIILAAVMAFSAIQLIFRMTHIDIISGVGLLACSVGAIMAALEIYSGAVEFGEEDEEGEDDIT